MDYEYDYEPYWRQANQVRTYCYPFQHIQNLTEFEAKVADKLCSIDWATSSIINRLDDSHGTLKGVTIASLVLNAITVLSIFIYLLYSLYSYRKKQKQVAI